MKLIQLIRNPFALIGQGFVLGGLLFVTMDGAHADPRVAPPATAPIVSR